MKKTLLILLTLLFMITTAQAEENSLLTLYLPAIIHGKQTSPEANKAKSASLHGCWQFDYNVGTVIPPTSVPLTDRVCLDSNTIIESKNEKDAYYIYGVSEFNVPVAAGYLPSMNWYQIMIIGSIIIDYFTFNDFTTPDTVSGCYHLIDYSGNMSACYPMTGHRIADLTIIKPVPYIATSSIETASKFSKEKQLVAIQGQQNQVPSEIAESLRSARAALPSQ